MKRLLIFLIDGDTGEIQVLLGKETEMREILKDHMSKKGNGSMACHVNGPATNIKALEVAFDVENEVMAKRWEDPGGLQTLLVRVLNLGASGQEKIKIARLTAVRKKRQKKAGK